MSRQANIGGTYDLYRYWDVFGNLLYLGQSVHAAVRMSGHRRSAKHTWWLDVEKITIERVPAERIDFVEREAIKREKPRYNVQYNTRISPRDNPTYADMGRPLWDAGYSLQEIGERLGLGNRPPGYVAERIGVDVARAWEEQRVYTFQLERSLIEAFEKTFGQKYLEPSGYRAKNGRWVVP